MSNTWLLQLLRECTGLGGRGQTPKPLRNTPSLAEILRFVDRYIFEWALSTLDRLHLVGLTRTVGYR